MPVFPKGLFDVLYKAGEGAGRAHVQEFYVARLRTIIGVGGKPQIDAALAASDLTEEQLKLARTVYGQAVNWCDEFGLPATAAKMKELLALASRPPVSELAMMGLMDDLAGRMIAELKAFEFIYITREKARYYGKPNLFGDKVADNFTAASFDVEEAGNCYATDRGTACVMHLMRALEVAIDALGRGVGLLTVVADAKQSWTKALKDIADQIGINDKGSDPTWTTAKSQFFKDSRAHLFAVKVAWRDTAMHLDKKYTPDEAERIYNASKDFMSYLAEHLDESGKFTP